MNCLVGKEKNIMPTTGPKSFARVREDWTKERKQQEIPHLLRCLLQQAKRSKLSCELKASSSLSTPTSGTWNAVAAIFNSKDNKKCQFPLYRRGVSRTLLKQKAMLEEAKKKHDEKIESLQNDYEDKRQQDKQELASDGRSHKDVQSRHDSSKMLQLHSSTNLDCLNDQ
ncbi:Granule-bound starch synthase 1 chloroplastic/amyloplastic, partial [Bienertia sinuspersici]